MSSLVFRITGDPTSFKAAMADVSSSLDRVGQKASSTSSLFESLGSKLTIGLTLPAVALGVGVVKAASDMDTLKRALLSTAGSAEEAEKQFGRLLTIAKLPGIGLPEAVRGSIRLQNYGFSAELAEKALKSFSNAVAGAGGTADDTQESLRQLGQIAGRGKVTMDNLRIVLERVPQAAKIIRKEFGPEALGDPAKFFGNLGINGAKFAEILINKLGELPPVTAGIKTSLENLHQEFTLAAARIGEHLVPSLEAVIPKLEAMATGAADLLDAFLKLPEPLKNTAIAIGGLALAAGPVATVVTGLIRSFGTIAAVAGTAGSGVVALFVAPIAIGIGQVLGLMDQVEDRLKQLELRKTGKQEIIKGQEGASLKIIQPELLGASSNAANRLKIDLKALSDEMGGFGLTAAKAAVATGHTTEKTKELAKELKVVKTITADSAGETKFEKLARLFEDGKVSAGEYAKQTALLNAQLKDGSLAGDKLSETSLAYIESLERQKTVTGKLKDVMFDYFTAHEVWGKKIQLAIDPLKSLAVASEEYSLSLRALIADTDKISSGNRFTERLAEMQAGLKSGALSSAQYAEAIRGLTFELAHLADMPAIKTVEVNTAGASNQIRGSLSEADALLSAAGGTSSHQKQVDIANIEASLARIKVLNQEGKATGDDVIQIQEKLRKAYEESGNAGVKNTVRHARALNQISTTITDLSRGFANAAVGLIFERGKVDVSNFKTEIVSLTAEQDKLLAAQKKGQNVSAQLAVVQDKLAEANRKMGEALQKASFGFRAMEAGKEVIKDVAKAIIRNLVEDALVKLSKSLLNVGGIFGKVFGGGTGVIKSATGGGGGVGDIVGSLGGGGGASSGIGSSLSSGVGGAIGGWIGLGSQVVSAVSGVVSNFQFAHMNTALGRIEESTRYLSIYTGQQSQSLLWCAQTTAAHMQYATASLDSIARYASEILGNIQQINQGKTVAAPEGGTAVNVSMAGAYFLNDSQMNDFADRFARYLKPRLA